MADIRTQGVYSPPTHAALTARSKDLSISHQSSSSIDNWPEDSDVGNIYIEGSK